MTKIGGKGGSQCNLIDPRGHRREVDFRLAQRVIGPATSESAVLFYDNTKLDVGFYRQIFQRLELYFRSVGVYNIKMHRETIRGKGDESILEMAQQFKKMGVSAVILALGDMGVSPAMVVLTCHLEQLGIPSVCITAGPGYRMACAVAYYRARNLCLINLDIYPGTGQRELIKLVDETCPKVYQMISANGKELEQLGTIDFPLDKDTVSIDGVLSISIDKQENPSDFSSLEAIYDHFDQLAIGDGLPFIPPTEHLCQKMQKFCPHKPDEVLIQGIGPTGHPIRVKDLVVASVMAGCKPEYFPVIITALKAMAKPKYNLLQAITTSHGGGNFILVSGPLAQQIGMHGRQGCLGPGFRANATVGRAINLVLTNICRSVPGFADLSCLSSPAEYSYCMAEEKELSPWSLLNEEQLDLDCTIVLVLMAESPHSIMDLASTSPESLLETIIHCCTTLGSNNAYLPGNLVLVLNPDHARILANGGYYKQTLSQTIYQRAVIPTRKLIGRGIVGMGPDRMVEEYHHVTRDSSDVIISVAGGRGGHSAVILPWSLHSEAVILPVLNKYGEPARHINEFISD